MSRVGKSILKGLEEALDHTEGKDIGAAVHRVAKVPDEIDVKRIRDRLGMSQARFAAAYGFSVDSVRNWEQGRRKPDVSARALLTVIDREPEAVNRALAS
jgi:putative transcriptional regulator